MDDQTEFRVHLLGKEKEEKYNISSTSLYRSLMFLYII